MSSPTRGHQRISKNLAGVLLQFERSSRLVQVYYAPLDVLIRKIPLRTRQPDLVVISKENAEAAGVSDETPGLPTSLELVIEILSDSDRKQALTG
ncbi:MAG TPA: Uma2 family endonuclease, partial [Chthonomonadaceae bacterium]|nr:Uma2 family endonuclease [Chthonomonadaceae bacterium]